MDSKLNYEALESKSNELFSLISYEQDFLRENGIVLSSFFTESQRVALNNTLTKIAVKMTPEKITKGAGPLAALFVANPVIGAAVTVVAGGALAVDSVRRSIAEQEAKNQLEEAFKCLEVNLEKMDEVMNQRMQEGIRRNSIHISETQDIINKMSEIQAFINDVTI